MNKAKLLLATIGLFAVVGGAFAFKARQDLKLYYLSTTQPGQPPVCFTVASLTTTTATTNTVSVPAGATGWYTVDICSGDTFKARTINN